MLGVLQVISAGCVARDVQTVALSPLDCTCVGQFAVQSGDCRQSQITPFGAIIIVIVRHPRCLLLYDVL